MASTPTPARMKRTLAVPTGSRATADKTIIHPADCNSSPAAFIESASHEIGHVAATPVAQTGNCAAQREA